jgi:LSD1 subclass zinc finger protein
MAVAFTCNKCSHRMAATFLALSYERGVVIVRCAKCASLHLIADNLKWFGEDASNVETILAEKGIAVPRLRAEESARMGGGGGTMGADENLGVMEQQGTVEVFPTATVKK